MSHDPDFVTTKSAVRHLIEHGYVVFENVVDADTRHRLLEEFEIRRLNSNSTYSIKTSHIVTSSQHCLGTILQPLISVIDRETDLGINHLAPTGVFFDTQIMNLPWHQDHESYYMWQNPYYSVNFWIPILKQFPKKSGVSVVSHKTLAKHIGPQFDQHIRNQGAKRFVPHNDVTDVFDDESGELFQLPINIDTIADTPEVSMGDILVMRGDLIHQTQPCDDSRRLAFATPAMNDRRLISRQRFYQRSPMKQKFMDSNQKGIQKMHQIFADHNQDHLPIRLFITA